MSSDKLDKRQIKRVKEEFFYSLKDVAKHLKEDYKKFNEGKINILKYKEYYFVALTYHFLCKRLGNLKYFLRPEFDSILERKRLDIAIIKNMKNLDTAVVAEFKIADTMNLSNILKTKSKIKKESVIKHDFNKLKKEHSDCDKYFILYCERVVDSEEKKKQLDNLYLNKKMSCIKIIYITPKYAFFRDGKNKTIEVR